VTLQPRPNADEFIGQVIAGKYRLLKTVGVGGMGGVYLAEQIDTRAPLAIKILHPDRQQKENIVRRFEREAKITSALKHPNIVEVYDFGQDPSNGAIYLAMEYLDGKTLYRFVRERQYLDLHTAGEITLAILASLENAHENKIIHRDLKPGNVMIMERPGQPLLVKVLDFGIAKIYDPENSIGGAANKPPTVLTQFGEMLGTPHYMPPEQIRGQDLTISADLYALGVILFFMLTGRRPFEGQEGIRVTIAQLTQLFPRLASISTSAELPPNVQELLDKAGKKEPKERFQTAAEFRQALEKILRETPAAPPRVPTQAQAPAAPNPVPARPPSAASLPAASKPPSASSLPGVKPPSAASLPAVKPPSGSKIPLPPPRATPPPAGRPVATAPATPPQIRKHTPSVPPPPAAPRPANAPVLPRSHESEADDRTRAEMYQPPLEGAEPLLGGDGPPLSARPRMEPAPTQPPPVRKKDPLMTTIPGNGVNPWDESGASDIDSLNPQSTIPQTELPESVRAVIEARKRANAAPPVPPTPLTTIPEPDYSGPTIPEPSAPPKATPIISAPSRPEPPVPPKANQAPARTNPAPVSAKSPAPPVQVVPDSYLTPPPIEVPPPAENTEPPQRSSRVILAILFVGFTSTSALITYLLIRFAS
jgi:serine/threonine-protein kinase